MNRPSSSREQAVLHTPGSNLVLVAGTVFALAGAGIVALGLGREDPREEALRTFLLVFGGVFLAAGSGLIVQRLRLMSRRVLVEHDEAAAPDLEDAPILAEGSHTESTCAHLLVLEGEGGKLIPDPNVNRLRIAGLVAFGLALYAGMVAIFFGFRPLDDMVDEIQNSDLAHGVASGLALMPLAAGLGIIAYVMNRTLGSRITLRFGPQDWSIEHADVTIVSGSRAELIAVQALAARERAIAAFLSQIDRLDAILLPTLPFPAIPVAEVDETRAPMAMYTRWVNYLNLAGLAVPTTLSGGGLPMSLQIVVRRLEEPLALRIGHAFEEARGAFPMPPSG